ncbi:N-alpha-acetyltransferase 30 isoform X1 [Salvelinus sp. IW2-2015]|uniref:N-alpha-acetyltransferase 30 isoform X1 n=1 Tax=Salvelinus sp. IW2-2015 TaxID=2691554 RepID=UPI000CDFC747|nr:N-alpha-acetyltransferase 30 isoform X1 [Salvelinus alpinus]
MAAVPTGPSSALPASPAEIIPFPGDGSVEHGQGEQSGCGREGSVASGARQEQQVSEDKRSSQKKQKNMLSHANPAALHLKTQALQEQKMNGLVSLSENRPKNLRTSTEYCDNSSFGDDPSDKNNSDHCCQHEDHSPCSKGSHPHLNNNSMNGMLTITRTEAIQSHPVTGDSPGGNVRKGECDPTEAPRPPSQQSLDCEGPGEPRAGVESEPDASYQPPVSELARLDLNCCRGEEESQGIHYVRYESELQMPGIMRLITKDLSEPYSIYTYRYFIHNWPQLCFLELIKTCDTRCVQIIIRLNRKPAGSGPRRAMVEQECVGGIVCKLDMHKKMFRRGYIAMLAVDSKHRRKSIGTNLVKKAIYAMVEGDCDEVVLETEITNKSALKLYENLGFVRDKRLFRYYLNGVDALRLKLWLR